LPNQERLFKLHHWPRSAKRLPANHSQNSQSYLDIREG
jgi:hypothetical protein